MRLFCHVPRHNRFRYTGNQTLAINEGCRAARWTWKVQATRVHPSLTSDQRLRGTGNSESGERTAGEDTGGHTKNDIQSSRAAELHLQSPESPESPESAGRRSSRSHVPAPNEEGGREAARLPHAYGRRHLVDHRTGGGLRPASGALPEARLL